MTIAIDPSVLLGWYQSFYGGSGTGTGSTSINAGGSGGTGPASLSAPPTKYAPTPPWDPSVAHPTESQAVQQALSGAKLIDPGAAKLDLPGASSDYKNLFALYQGLTTLFDIADTASAKNVSSFQLKQLSSAFSSGMSQVSQFVAQTGFQKLRLTTGGTATSTTSTVSTPAQPTSYLTPALNTTGDSSAVVPAFQGAVVFDVTVQTGGGAPTVVHMDLSQMGATPRTMANVLAYLNGQMQAAGAITTFSSQYTPATPQLVSLGGSNNLTLSQNAAQWSLKVNTDPFETVSFSAPTTDSAVYIGQIVGNQSAVTGPDGKPIPPDAQSQLVKLQTSGTLVTPPLQQSDATPGRIFVDSLGNPVNAIQATATAPDGSVYVLADVNATTGGAPVAGGQDVALMKYDSAGKLIFTSDLGSASSASGLSLAVSADGSKVAVAGSVAGPLTTGQTLNNPTGTNSFVTVFDPQGEQVWSQQRDGLSANQANAVAFGADGSVYVTGQTQPGVGTDVLGPQAPSNAYLQVYSPTGVQSSFTQFGGGTANVGSGVAVDGSNVYVAGTQDGRAVVSEYSVSNPAAPSLVATRDLGDLQGGNVVGVAVQNGTVYVAGSTHNGALAAGTVTSAASGGLDAFAATLSTGLAAAPSDAIAYYGGAGDESVSAMTVSNGDVWLTGSTTGALPNEPAIGAHDGFVAALNVGAGAVDWSQRFTGLDGKVAPTSIAVASAGASILDQLGLPQGVVDGPVSDLVTATTPVKAGDSFSIAADGGTPVKVTVAADDTMATLATKISRATGFTVNVSTQTLGGSTTLEIQPLDASSTVTLSNGPAGADALSELGLKAGILDKTVTQNGRTVPADGKGQIYGLGLDPTLNLGSAAAINHAKAQITAALSVLKGAYQNLLTAATPANVLALQKAQAATGKVPAYLTSQIANYQAALNRLTGSQNSNASLTSLFGA
ncbi:MAG: beta strand repeat-containing protein [Caulobacterales bacterium]